MLKLEMAEMLADNEYSVQRKITPRQYWINAYMRMRKAELIAKVEKLTNPR